MKLARKLTLAFVAGMCIVLGLTAVERVRRQIDLYETDMRRDHHVLGHAMAEAVALVWRHDGEATATAMTAAIGRREPGLSIRFVRLDAAAGDPGHPEVARAQLDALRAGHDVVLVTREGDSLVTLVPVHAEGAPPGAIEVMESLAQEHRFARAVVMTTLATTIALTVVGGVLAMLLGTWFVGRPVRVLIEQARRIGAGDLSRRLALRQRDEIRELAEEMNAMCDRLQAAHAKIDTETSGRIAAMDQLRHADRLTTVGKLASGVAHELGTPLNVVSGRARMIQSGEVRDAAAQDNARIIAEQAGRMAQTIRQLLDFARRSVARKAPQDVRQLAEQTVALLAPLAQKNRVSLVVAPSGPAAAVAEIDAGQIQQALTNLVVNGIQAIREGGAVTVSVDKTRVQPPADHGGPAGEYVRLDVRDVGEGIPPERVSHVFEPFFTTKEVGEGTGLGLSVAYGLVREHGGWITLESEVGVGTLFSIYLPQGRTA